ncbi:MBL fold metallo-hydrolase [Parabacteroides sp. PF5-9]|uniref:MBL fold metallo-hydrolase n=1 Tax=Parabacteroides sp. PF5-9 TaxID=1742404 RepID=UPI0024769F6B|nr:MBL fold metallo-hydrolase [Parabacteroides sp. PF5-9]MDH6358481.1 glyoxylase-like metal-dependent hydrolase (beta-lactamase superfamily II) [Parabacteroides sp. PF5-9]
MKSKQLLITCLWVFLATFQVAAQVEEYPFTYSLGQINITLLPEGGQQGSKDILIGATDEMLKQYVPEGTFPNAVNAFLLETPENTILVDAGFGRKLFAHLESCNKTPEAINIILLTHMHGDHIGGLLKDGKKSFPSAILYIPKPEYDYWMSDQEMQRLPEDRRGGFTQARRVIDAYKDKLELFVPGELEGTDHEIVSGIRGIAAYGHTPGHTAYLLESEGEEYCIWGDLAHAMPIQMPYPQVAVTYDTDPAKAVESRQRLLKYVADNNVEIGGMHIEYPGMVKIKGNAADGYRYILTCTCEGVLR